MSPREGEKLPVLNRAAFEEIAMHDAALQRELMSAFLRELPGARHGLSASALSGPQAFFEEVHRLRSCCQFIAAERLLAYLETLARLECRTTQPERELAIPRIEMELRTLEIQAQDWLAQNLPDPS